MSPIRILVALLIAGLILASEFFAYWHFGFSEKWIPMVLLAVVAVAGGVLMEIQTRKALRPYWERACTGIRWRRQFPDAPKTEIREFLDLFNDAFGFRRARRCCFQPGDKVMDVYHAVYPPGSAVDGMELETFCTLLRKRYGIDFAASWREDITLGEIYAQTLGVA
jgi:hypothetical protein